MEDKEKNAPIALFMFALVIVAPVLLVVIFSTVLLFQKQNRLEEIVSYNTQVELLKLTVTPTPTIKPTLTATPSPTLKFQYYYPTKAVAH